MGLHLTDPRTGRVDIHAVPLLLGALEWAGVLALVVLEHIPTGSWGHLTPLAIGWVLYGVVTALLTITSLIMYFVLRPPLRGQRAALNIGLILNLGAFALALAFFAPMGER
jgi:hypothetical protein